ncbi:TetR family transcriptional regulator [Granulicella sp. 5B5]|nr:TetR family transcriptional regulator [Granulicella sp. 5B5]
MSGGRLEIVADSAQFDLEGIVEAPALIRESETSQDPRIRRTRDLLQQALDSLLKQKEFDRISVQDITDEAGVNRATFYAHYPDKFALLECKVAGDFNALLVERGVTFDGTCAGALRSIVLGVCDFLALTQGSACQRQRQMEPHLETAMVAVVRKMLLDGLRRHDDGSDISPDLRAATISWAILGAAKEWVRTPERPASDEIAGTVVRMIAPILHPAD